MWKAPKRAKEVEPMHDWKSLSHVRWDCKYHVSVYPEISKTSNVRKTTNKNRRDSARFVSAERIGVVGRPCEARAYPSMLEHTAKIQCSP